LVAAAEVAGPQLPDEIAAALAVPVGDAALAGVLHRAGDGDAAVDRLDRRRAERAVAHRRRVDDRARAKRLLPAARAPEDLRRGAGVRRVVARVTGVRRREGERRLADDDVPRRLLEVVVGAEAEVAVLFLRRGVDPAALVAAERPLGVVAGHDVLAER